MNNWLTTFGDFSRFAGFGFILGLFIWAEVAKRRARLVLSVGQRGALALLLGGLLFAWWASGRTFAPPAANATNQEFHGPLSDELADHLNIVAPAATSFAQPDIRTVGARQVVMLLPPGTVEWRLGGSQRAVEITYGFEPTSYEQGTTNGAEVIVELSDHGKTKEIFRRFLDPIGHPSDKGLQRSLVDLPAFSPGSRLYLRTAPGPFGDTSWDWVYLAGFRYKN